MAIGTQGSVGKATTRSGPKVGKKGKTAGPVGKRKGMHGSALSLDQDKTKVGYPTTTTV